MSLKTLMLSALSLLLAVTAAAADRPNVVVVVVDDVGYMDFGAFGGEARTPTIDALAARGAKMTRYYTSPQCAPSRAMLLTGADNHSVGIGTIPEVVTERMRRNPGYTMRLPEATVTLADRLGAAGYQTFAIGKWGIGDTGSSLPPDFGFDHSYVLDASGADNWQQKTYLPYYLKAEWFEDGVPVQLPEDYYSSELIVDKAMQYIDAADPSAPFFAYVAFQAVHIPIQAPLEFIKNYDGVYDEGWTALRRDRQARARALGLVSEDATIADMPKGLRDWDKLDAGDRALLARMMQVNAGMLEAMDHHLGRLVDHLDRIGVLDDTIIVVVSDNGPEYNVLENQAGIGLWLSRNGYETEVETLGQKGSMAYIGPEWASAAASPFALFKFHSTEGGLRVPMVIAGPGVPATGFVSARAHVTDVMPTILDLAGVALAADKPGSPPVRGRSLTPVLAGRADEVYGPDETVAFEVSGNVALYRGQWKAMRLPKPLGDGAWHLYDLSADPGETTDVAGRQPVIFAELLNAYQRYAAEVGVIDPGPRYNPIRQAARNIRARQRARVALPLGLFGAASLLLGAYGLFRWRRLKRAAATSAPVAPTE